MGAGRTNIGGSGEKLGTTAMAAISLSNVTSTEMLNVTGKGVLKSVSTRGSVGSKAWKIIVDGVTFPTSMLYAMSAQYDERILDIPFNTSLKVYFETGTTDFSIIYELNGVPMAATQALSTPANYFDNLNIVGSGRLKMLRNDSLFSVIIDGINVIGTPTMGTYLTGQFMYFDTEFKTSLLIKGNNSGAPAFVKYELF